MKRLSKRFLAFALALILTISGLCVGREIELFAAENTETVDQGERTLQFVPEYKSFGIVSTEEFEGDVKVTVESDNKKVAEGVYNKENKWVYVTAKKVGSANFTVTVKSSEKTVIYTQKMTWVKYTNPLKSLKIGNTTYKKSFFNENTQAGMKKVKGKQKVSVKLKDGYTLTGLGFSRGGQWNEIKNGDKINFTKKGTDNTVLFVYYTDKNGHEGALRLFVNDKNCAM